MIRFRIGVYLAQALHRRFKATQQPDPCPAEGVDFPADHPCVDWLLENMPGEVVVYNTHPMLDEDWILSNLPDWVRNFEAARKQYAMQPLEEFLSCRTIKT